VLENPTEVKVREVQIFMS